MRKIVLGLLGLLALSPATAGAGLLFGVGAGGGKPSGSVAHGAAMADAVTAMVPIEAELGWKLFDRLTVVGLAEMDLGTVGGDLKRSCDAEGTRCAVNQTRVGGQLRWNFLPGRGLDPWLGAGVAQEVLGVERGAGSTATTFYFRGLAIDAAAGVDLRVGESWAVTPWVRYSLGKYQQVRDGSVVGAPWEKLAGQERHALAAAGLRVSWDYDAPARTPSRGQ